MAGLDLAFLGVLLVEEAEPVPASVLDLLSDAVAGFDSPLPPSFDDTFEVDSFEVDSFAADSFGVDSFDSDPESDDVPFFRASEG